jgi:hypothetical protein
MSHRHKLVQSWSAQYSVEREADLRNIEEDALRMEIFCRPKCNREGDATTWSNRHWAHSEELALRVELPHRYLQLLEGRKADEIEGRTPIN